jgi:hypothetical protein
MEALKIGPEFVRPQRKKFQFPSTSPMLALGATVFAVLPCRPVNADYIGVILALSPVKPPFSAR